MVEEGNFAGLRPGQKVRSIQGRDRGQEYLLVGFEGDRFLLVADGVKRTAEHPKRKNLRHVQVSPLVDREIEQKITGGGRVTAEEIRRALARLGKTEPEEGSNGQRGCY
ncbi:MAG: RNA-binding protein [Firmicutes bacterium]|jgi:ribosomal protein L14E/L6E/L27E|nr:RNA-binding protein [Bacillota bacterium]